MQCLLPEHRDSVGESPLWHPAEAAWYWVDIEAPALRRWRDDRLQSWATPERIACIALHADGGFVAALETGLFRLQPHEDGTLTLAPLASVEHPLPGMRFNDGRCDRQGRFFAGTMLRDMAAAAPAGALYRLDGAGGLAQLSAPLVDGLIVPNGLAFSAEGRTMYLSDSHPQVRKIWAFDLDAQGRPTGRRLFVDMKQHPGRPDGAAIDADGCYWICANDAGRVHRFTPEGRLDRSLEVPTLKPAMCSFGGAQLDELLITTICPAGSTDPLAGAVFLARPGVQGVPETAFRP